MKNHRLCRWMFICCVGEHDKSKFKEPFLYNVGTDILGGPFENCCYLRTVRRPLRVCKARPVPTNLIPIFQQNDGFTLVFSSYSSALRERKGLRENHGWFSLKSRRRSRSSISAEMLAIINYNLSSSPPKNDTVLPQNDMGIICAN